MEEFPRYFWETNLLTWFKKQTKSDKQSADQIKFFQFILLIKTIK